jgi:membrane-bound inhibitor of C-type lysozyme
MSATSRPVGHLAWAMLLVAAGCGTPQREAPGGDTSAASSATPAPGSVADETTRTVAFICGDTPLAIQVHADAIDLVLADATHRLAQVVAASGARYEATVNGETYTFWDRGGEATFTVGDRRYPTCQRVDPAAPSPAS